MRIDKIVLVVPVCLVLSIIAWYFFGYRKAAQEPGQESATEFAAAESVEEPVQKEKPRTVEEMVSYRSMDYLLIKPAEYDPSEKYPLVVFFHDGDLPEKNREKPATIRRKIYDASSEAVKDYPCFVLIPQPPQVWWTFGKTGSLLAEIRKYIDYHLADEFSLDPNRYYAVGNSFGGTALLHMLAWNPDYFAAAIPIAAWLVPENLDQQVLKQMAHSSTAVWMFSSADDPVADWSVVNKIPNTFRRAGGNLMVSRVKGGHSAPMAAYAALCNGDPVKITMVIYCSPLCDRHRPNPIQWMFDKRLDRL